MAYNKNLYVHDKWGKMEKNGTNSISVPNWEIWAQAYYLFTKKEGLQFLPF